MTGPRALAAASHLTPGALVLYLGFNAGGYPAGVASFAAVGLAVLLALRALAGDVRRPGIAGAAALVALALLTVWTLFSATWSQAPARAALEADRTLLYLLVVATFATLPRPALAPVVRGLAAAIVVICATALVARLLFGIEPHLSPHRLTWPLTYWNALGLLMALGALLCVHLTSRAAETPRVRTLAAAAVPALVCALYLTQSRAALGLAAAGLAAYAVLARPRGLAAGALAVLPGTVVVMIAALASPALIGLETADEEVASQGLRLALVIVLAGLGSARLREVLGPVDRWAEALRPPVPSRRAIIAAAVGAVALLAVGSLASGAPARVYDRFVAPTRSDDDPRGRLLQISNAGRLDHWRVALEASRGERLHGTGAGTFVFHWDRLKPVPRQVTEAHSLYVETLAELGVVGLGLVVSMLAALLAGPLTARGEPRQERALVAVAAVLWLAHAALEWDWEMPALTVVFLALAAAAAPSGRALRPRTGAIVAAVAVGLAVLPALTAISEVRLHAAVEAYDRGDCAAAARDAAGADRLLLATRPQPQLVQGLCAARAGRSADAVAAVRAAVAREPANWEYHWNLALVTATGGGDPRPQLRAVAARQPTGAAGLLDSLGIADRDPVRRAALARRLPVIIDRDAHPPLDD